jgi:hypothetical protein
MHGAARSSIPGVHEFTTAGIYAADALEGALYYHAVATRLCAPEDEQDRIYDASLTLCDVFVLVSAGAHALAPRPPSSDRERAAYEGEELRP